MNYSSSPNVCIPSANWKSVTSSNAPCRYADSTLHKHVMSKGATHIVNRLVKLLWQLFCRWQNKSMYSPFYSVLIHCKIIVYLQCKYCPFLSHGNKASWRKRSFSNVHRGTPWAVGNVCCVERSESWTCVGWGAVVWTLQVCQTTWRRGRAAFCLHLQGETICQLLCSS